MTRFAGLVPLFLAATMSASPLVIPLWPEGVPGGRAAGADEYFENGRIYNVRVPTLTYFPAPEGTANGSAVIVCPGGGYMQLSVDNEGHGMTRWLNANGVAVFQLKYRHKDYGHPAPMQDVMRAMRIVRSRAAEFGIDPNRIGAAGSSAGGHLAAMAGTLFDHPLGRTGDALDVVNARPDFLILQYPVVLMESANAHGGSRRALLGTSPSPEDLALLSLDRQVTAATPPAFIVATAEDSSVPLENSVALFTALRNAGVPSELHLYEKGAHGFGFRKDLGTTSEWPTRAEEWMRSHGWLPPSN